MRNVLKATTLESKFPLLSVENNCIVSKEADITFAFQVELPEIFTLTAIDYETIHSTWCKAIKTLPYYSIVHKQDWFIEEKYTPDLDKELSFLSRASEKHFNERPYLNHYCYLFLTQTTRERVHQQSNFNTLCRGRLIPKEVNKERIIQFSDAVEQFMTIVNDSGFVKLTRLSEGDITGTKDKAGIVEKYFSLTQDTSACLHDIVLGAGEMKIGDKILCLHTLSNIDDLPGNVMTDFSYGKLSTDRSDCNLSYAAPVGLLLECNHVYNQFITLGNPGETLRRFEKQSRNMHSLSRYSRANEVNSEWIEKFLNDAHDKGLFPVCCSCNVFAWSDDRHELKRIKNNVGSQLALMECKPRHNVIDVPTLFWAAIPGNEGDFPAEDYFHTFLEQAVCLFTEETNYCSSLSPFGIKMVDRLTGKPLHLDISDLPLKQGWTTNRNKFVIGPSGSGKSFFMNHLIRGYYEQGSHVLIVDTGNSYLGLCELINSRSKGEDGIYFTYTRENPITFNPFYVEDGMFDIEKKESIKTLILTLWKRENEIPTRAEEVALSNALNSYIARITNDKAVRPCFDTFYEFVRDDYREELISKRVREKDFDIHGFLNILQPYYHGGEYDYLLNSDKEMDLLNKRLIIFELDSIKDHKILFPITTIIIMETFINKMRKLPGVRKLILIEEAWKAIASANMADYIKYLYKTVRKHFGEAITVTQEIEDIISSPIVKESIINNSDCKILLDQRKYVNKFDSIQNLLGLSEKEKAQILSINLANNSRRKYKEVWIGLGGTRSAVYGTEVSTEEYYTYTTEQTEKVELQNLTQKLGGNFELAIKRLAESTRNNQ